MLCGDTHTRANKVEDVSDGVSADARPVWLLHGVVGRCGRLQAVTCVGTRDTRLDGECTSVVSGVSLTSSKSALTAPAVLSVGGVGVVGFSVGDVTRRYKMHPHV